MKGLFERSGDILGEKDRLLVKDLLLDLENLLLKNGDLDLDRNDFLRGLNERDRLLGEKERF